jgi:drug/metabolite transporter (DMT)-like permease
MHKEHSGLFYGVLSAFAGVMMALFVKLSPSASLNTLIFIRFSIGLPWIFWLIYKGQVDISLAHIPKNLVRCLAGVFSLYAYFFSLSKLPLVNAVTFSSTAPLYLPFLVLIWQKLLVSKLRFFVSIVGFLGVVVLLHPAVGGMEIGSLVGLAGGLCAAIAFLSIRILSKTQSALSILSYYFIVGSALSFFPFLYDRGSVQEPIEWLYILLSGIFALIFQYALTQSYSKAPATKVGVMSYLGIIFSALLGWLILGEELQKGVLLGVFLIICSALLAVFDKTKPKELGKS